MNSMSLEVILRKPNSWCTDPLPIKQSKNVPRNSANQIRISSFWVRTHLLSFSSRLTNLSDILIGRSINRNVETNQKINFRYNTDVYIANKFLWFNYRHFSFEYSPPLVKERVVAWTWVQLNEVLIRANARLPTIFSLYIDIILRNHSRGHSHPIYKILKE